MNTFISPVFPTPGSMSPKKTLDDGNNPAPSSGHGNISNNASSRVEYIGGIANRHYLDSRLQAEWNRAIREQAVLGLLMIDVDFFKTTMITMAIWPVIPVCGP